MSDDVLSQDEVESLISAMDNPAKEGKSQGSSPASGSANNAQNSGLGSADNRTKNVGSLAAENNPFQPTEKITPYDFKRPERVGKEQMRALQTMHEGFGRNFGAALSALLRTVVEVKLTSVDQLTYSEFVFSLENPTCFNLINANPLEGQLILDINPSLLFPIIDRLLGGGSTFSGPIRRPLTEIELRLVSRLTDLFLGEMKNAWANVLELELEVDRVESNPQLVQIVPPNEVVVLVSFELTLGEVRGMINLCIPFNSIERIGNQLSANSWASYSSRPPSNETIQNISTAIGSSVVEVVVELAETHITTGDMIGLRVGDIIATEKDIYTPMVVSVENRPKYYASPGVFKGHKAFQVTETIEEHHLKYEEDQAG